MTTHVELYRALEPHIGPQAAELIAEVVPSTANLATQDNIAELHQEIAAVHQALALQTAETHAKFAELRSDIFRWNLMFFVPLWLGVWGTLVALAVKELAA